MNTLTTELGYLLLMFLPVAALIFSLFRELNKDRAASTVPFSELRRPAGESNRLRVQELDECIDPWLSILITIPILFALVLTLQKPSWPLVIFCFLLLAIVAAIVHRILRRLIRRRASYRLGFHGERFVAEELNQLMSDGFRVFHDVPFGKYNIDHVLVGSTGAFVRRRRKGKRRTPRVYASRTAGKHSAAAVAGQLPPLPSPAPSPAASSIPVASAAACSSGSGCQRSCTAPTRNGARVGGRVRAGDSSGG